MSLTTSLSTNFLQQLEKLTANSESEKKENCEVEDEEFARVPQHILTHRDSTIQIQYPNMVTEDVLTKFLFHYTSIMSLTPVNWAPHIFTLVKLEQKFRKSPAYSYEKSVTIFENHIEQIKQIGFEINEKYIKRNPPDREQTYIDIATKLKCPSVMEALFNKGVDKSDPDFMRDQFLFLKYGTYGMKHRTTLEKIDQCLKVLINNGFDVNKKLKVFPFNNLIWSAYHDNSPALLTSLVKAKADINSLYPWPSAKDPNKKITLLEKAVLQTASVPISMFKTIIRLGANVFSLSGEEFTLTVKKSERHYDEATIIAWRATKIYLNGPVNEMLLTVIPVRALSLIIVDYLKPILTDKGDYKLLQL